VATQYGITTTGFVVKQQAVIKDETQIALQGALGFNINLLPEAVFGQLVGVFSEREALLWQLAEAVYTSQYPSGAEGASVDNILALNNLRRLPARATATAPTSTVGTPGLVLKGTPGTVILAGAIISVSGNTSLQFTLDEDVTILPAVNAVQLVSLFGGSPSQGAFTLQIVDPAGNALTTPTIQWNATATTTLISWATTPSSGAFVLGIGGLLTASLASNASAAAVQTAIQALAGYGAVTVTGSIAAGLVINWGAVSQPVVTMNATKVAFSADPTGSTFQISLNGTNAAAVAYNASAATLQAALRVIAGYEYVVVTGAATLASGFFINWGWATPATVAIVANPSGATLSVVQTNTLNHPVTLLNSIQAAVNTLYDKFTGFYPYTDVVVGGSLAAALLTVTFGSGTVVAGQPVSAAQPQALFTAPTNTLQNGTVVINLNASTSAVGAPAEGVGSATATVTGPNYVPAGFLSVIGSPQAGWTSVTNPLDCITGALVETDQQALTRRSTLLAAAANGPLQAIAEKVGKVTNVVQAIGFENVSLAADQTVSFAPVPTAGSFTMTFIGPSGAPLTTAAILWNALANIQVVTFSAVPPSGTFTLTFGAYTTGAIAYNTTASGVQAAVRLLPGYETTIVTGSFTLGFNIAVGHHPHLPVSATNSLGGGVTIATIPSVQSRINELTPYYLATVIGSFGAGFQVAFNGSAGSQPQTLITTVNGLTTTLTITTTFGRPGKSFEIIVNDNNGQADDAAIAQAIFDAKPAGIQSYGNVTVIITDSFGNPHSISFSRPAQVTIYMVVTLTTDLTTAAAPSFNPASIITIQEELVAIGDAFLIGGTIIGFGSGGLIGAFNNVPGINTYTLSFGTAPNPTGNTNIQLLPEQVADFQTFNIIVSYT